MTQRAVFWTVNPNPDLSANRNVHENAKIVLPCSSRFSALQECMLHAFG